MDESSPLDDTPAVTAADLAAAEDWLLTVAQLPTDDPASRMRVLRTLESLGSAVMRDGVYLLPDTDANRQSLEALMRDFPFDPMTLADRLRAIWTKLG